MRKKCIFGGTFDPIHNGHINIAYEALYNLDLDKVYFMPLGNPPHKDYQHITSASLRYEMVKMAIRNEEKFEVSSYEINKHNRSYTYETLRYFKNLEKNTEWYFIIGADCLFDLEQWKNTKEILKYCKLVVFYRKGYNKKDIYIQKLYLEKKYNTKIIILNSPLLEISSTDLRKKIKQDKRVDFLMPESVYNTVIKFNLYK